MQLVVDKTLLSLHMIQSIRLILCCLLSSAVQLPDIRVEREVFNFATSTTFQSTNPVMSPDQSVLMGSNISPVLLALFAE